MANLTKRSNQRSFPWIRVLIPVGIVIAGVLIAVLYKKPATIINTSSSSYSTTPTASPDNNQTGSVKTNTTSPTTNNSTTNSTSQTNSTKSGGSPPASFTVQIVNNDVYTNNNQTFLHIGDTVTGTTSGACSLTASKSGEAPVTLATSNVKSDVNEYDCGAFNVPFTSFPSTGTWQVMLSVTSNDTTASSSSVNVTVQ